MININTDFYRNKDECIIKVGTFFSGIGSPEKALEKLKNEKVIKDFKVEFFSEIDKDAVKSYCAIHDIDNQLNLGDIRMINGEDLPYCDLWVGGFPCQDISVAGKMKGFDVDNATRSSLGWEMIRLLKEVIEKPKYIIFENVANITSEKFINTLNLFKKDLISIGYTLYDNVLNAVDYGIPQTRKRYFLVAILNNCKSFSFPHPINNNFCLKDILETNVDEKYFLSNDKYEKSNNNKLVFHNKKNEEILYEIDLNKFYKGGQCGEDKHCNYRMSARIVSELGNSPTITACNTAYNCKIAVERG